MARKNNLAEMFEINMIPVESLQTFESSLLESLGRGRFMRCLWTLAWFFIMQAARDLRGSNFDRSHRLNDSRSIEICIEIVNMLKKDVTSTLAIIFVVLLGLRRG